MSSRSWIWRLLVLVVLAVLALATIGSASAWAGEGSGAEGGLDPADLQKAYEIPTTGGSTQTVAVIEAFGYAAAESDLASYRADYGLPACTKASGCFKKINQKGEEANYPPEKKIEEGFQVLSALDLDMASAACPACKLMLVEGEEANPAGSSAGAVNTAVGLGATEVSTNFGFPEQLCAEETEACENAAADYSHPGVVITAPAGDAGYNNSYEGYASPTYPATLPGVIAVGGTSLVHKDAGNARGWDEETVWNETVGSQKYGTGSGCSLAQERPLWQSTLPSGCEHRLDNDVAAVAGSPNAPLSLYVAAAGGSTVVEGTSGSAALIAGIMAHASESVRSAGPRAFYENASSMHDITSGSNGACAETVLCVADAGWDGPTGVGTPDGVPSSVRPSVAKAEPSEGPGAGGASVTISGSGFSEITAVKFGSTNATNFKVESVTKISAVAPAGAGAVDVTIVGSAGTSATSATDKFTYRSPPIVTGVNPDAGLEAGGTSVTITGTSFTGATAVKFGSVNAASFTVNSDTSITATSPPEAAGAVDVTVTTSGGTGSTSSADRFTYVPPGIQMLTVIAVATPPTKSVAPVVTAPKESTTMWLEGDALARFSVRPKLPIGTTFSFDLNESARVSLAFTQPANGRKVGKGCLAPNGQNKKEPKCTRTLARGTLSFTAHTGTNKVRFQGRISRSTKLKPGRYTVTITATNAAGQRSAPERLSFTIVK